MTIITIAASIASSIIVSLLISKRAIFFEISKNNTTGVRFASQSKPIFGGFIVLAGLVSCIILSSIFSERALQMLLLLIPLIISFSAGLLDDIKNTPPGFKFATQIATGIVIYVSNICPPFFTNEIANFALCVIWTITLMNSLNMLDNMDAITASVSSTILFSIISASLLFKTDFGLLPISIAFFFSLLVFLHSNWHPSSMYMGDNGSQLVGAIMAIITIHFFAPAGSQEQINIESVIPLLLSLSIPLTDTATVSINRILDGKSPFVGDKNHTTHNLFYLGFSIPKVGFIFIGATLLTNIAAIAIYFNVIDIFMHKLIAVLACTLICALFFITTKLKKNEA